MKIIHCSDLHLDSRMESNLPAAKAQARNIEICKTFSRMAEYAADKDVQAVLIAGDLFDTERVTSRTVDYILSVIQQKSQIDFLCLRGNHDGTGQAFLGRDLPENLQTFSDTWMYYHYNEDVCIAGVELTEKNFSHIYDALSLRMEDINIVMMHGQDSTQFGPDLVCLPALKGKGIAYLALGHRHSYYTGRLDMDGVYCYSGCLEGRGFDECGEKGFVQLDIAPNGKITQTFVPFAGGCSWMFLWISPV